MIDQGYFPSVGSSLVLEIGGQQPWMVFNDAYLSQLKRRRISFKTTGDDAE